MGPEGRSLPMRFRLRELWDGEEEKSESHHFDSYNQVGWRGDVAPNACREVPGPGRRLFGSEVVMSKSEPGTVLGRAQIRRTG